jgi:hypothetical protein
MYSAAWMRLDAALAHVVATGVADDCARLELCNAIADGAVLVRVQIDAADRHIGGRLLAGQNVKPPRRLAANDIDWMASKPLAAWETGPDPVQSYTARWSWRPREIALVEIAGDDVLRHWPPPESAGQAVPPPRNRAGGLKRRQNGSNYAIQDAPLVEEMRALLAAKAARSPEDAARAVVERAEGSGQPESKMKRLALRYRQCHPARPAE